jgi:putative membrane protein
MRKTMMMLPAALLLLAACSTTTDNMTSSSMPGMMSDADVAAVVTNANQGEIAQGQAASTRASSTDVRAFAQMMVNDHTNALNQARDLFSRTNINANTNNDVASNLQSNANQTLSALNTYNGSEFDRQYMQSQVDMHQWLLNSLDNTLIPSARNRDFRSFLQTQRSAVAMHLDRARQILGSLR